jgi:hypothetical protein
MKKFIVIVASLLLAACVTQPVQLTWTPIDFDEAEYAALQTVGTGVVRGSLFGRTVGGDVKLGAGQVVRLFPATKYTQQRYREQWIGGRMATKSEDPRYIKYVRETTVGVDGKFEFRSIPPGEYFAVSTVYWTAITRTTYGPISETQGGLVVKRFVVANDQTADVVLAY